MYLIITYYLALEQFVKKQNERKLLISEINCVYRKILRIFFMIEKIKF